MVPESAEAAVEAYGDGSDITVVGGGTIVMLLTNHQRFQPSKVLLLGKAGMSFVREDAGTVTVGATTPLSEITELVAPLGPCAANVADREIRGQATIGGNLCAPVPPEHPSGDLQGALLALDAKVRSTGAGGERVDGVEAFLPGRADRLVLDITFDVPAAGAFASFRRPHAHHFTPLAVSGVRTADGATRLAVTGTAAGTAVRLPSAEAVANDAEAAGAAAVADVELADDALVSAWYRARILPTLVARVLEELGA